MKFIARGWAVALAAGIVLTGCQSPPPRPAQRAPANLAIRNNCYSLLYQLLEEQKDVSLLRFIKREDSDVKKLVKRIAYASAADGRELKAMAARDPTIVLTDIDLPPGEVKTRDAIASTKQKLLLAKKGNEFELALLLTQTEAVNYAWHLAKVADEFEPNPDNARALDAMAKQMQDLYENVYLLLLSKTKIHEAH